MRSRTAIPDSHALRFGPYRPPKVFRGDKLFWEIRGTVTIGGYSEAPIPWPRVKKGGNPCLILCGDLVRAVRREAMLAVAHHWGISVTTVWKWRTARGVERWNEGSTQLMRDWESSREDDRLERAREESHRPAAVARYSATRRGSVNRHILLLDGARVRAVREERGLTRARLAAGAKLSYLALWRVETGRCTGLSRVRVERLAATLSVDVATIVRPSPPAAPRRRATAASPSTSLTHHPAPSPSATAARPRPRA